MHARDFFLRDIADNRNNGNGHAQVVLTAELRRAPTHDHARASALRRVRLQGVAQTGRVVFAARTRVVHARGEVHLGTDYLKENESFFLLRFL